MKYNEYKAPSGKVLLNLDNFTYGNTMISMFELNVIAVNEEDAQRLSQEYRKIMEDQEKQMNNIPSEDAPQTMSLRESDMQSIAEDAVLEGEEPSEIQPIPDVDELKVQLEDFKKNSIADLLLKNIKFDKSDVVLNQHESKYI